MTLNLGCSVVRVPLTLGGGNDLYIGVVIGKHALHTGRNALHIRGGVSRNSAPYIGGQNSPHMGGGQIDLH